MQIMRMERLKQTELAGDLMYGRQLAQSQSVQQWNTNTNTNANANTYTNTNTSTNANTDISPRRFGKYQ